METRKEAVWKIEPKAGMTGTVDFLPGYEADKEYPAGLFAGWCNL